MLEPSELAARDLPRFVACGYLEERGGVLHPGKYVRAVREQAIDAGVRLHESTPVDAIADGPTVRVETPRGSASAPVCVVATNAYTPQLGRLRSAVAPLHVSLFATEPLTEDQRERVGWSGGEGVYTAHEVLESFRLTADGRIVGGSRHVRWSYGGHTLPDQDADIFAALEAMFRARFPELADVAVERCWSGPIAMTLDFLPAVGRGGSHDNVLFGIGYNGHGVAQASYVGMLLAKMAQGEDPGHPELLRRRRLPMPPEPLRSLWARGLLAALRAVDRRTDRRAQPRPARSGGPAAPAPLDEEQRPRAATPAR
jgi:glycine/D-amino acid oxidase-like deaminating enzyme